MPQENTEGSIEGRLVHTPVLFKDMLPGDAPLKPFNYSGSKGVAFVEGNPLTEANISSLKDLAERGHLSDVAFDTPIWVKRKSSLSFLGDLPYEKFAERVKAYRQASTEELQQLVNYVHSFFEIPGITEKDLEDLTTNGLSAQKKIHESERHAAFRNLINDNPFQLPFSSLDDILSEATSEHIALWLTMEDFLKTQKDIHYHSAAVGMTSVMIGKILELDNGQLKSLFVAGSLHALGYAAIRHLREKGAVKNQDLLQKLEDAHPNITYKILIDPITQQPINGIKDEEARAAVACHYRYDGKREQQDKHPAIFRDSKTNNQYIIAGEEYKKGDRHRNSYEETFKVLQGGISIISDNISTAFSRCFFIPSTLPIELLIKFIILQAVIKWSLSFLSTISFSI